MFSHCCCCCCCWCWCWTPKQIDVMFWVVVEKRVAAMMTMMWDEADESLNCCISSGGGWLIDRHHCCYCAQTQCANSSAEYSVSRRREALLRHMSMGKKRRWTQREEGESVPETGQMERSAAGAGWRNDLLSMLVIFFLSFTLLPSYRLTPIDTGKREKGAL